MPQLRDGFIVAKVGFPTIKCFSSSSLMQTYRIRVELPAPLLRHAKIATGQEVLLDVAGPLTIRTVLDALEARYPQLLGTIRDHTTHERRPFLRFFVCAEDWSHQSPDTPLPAAIVDGREPLIILGAIAGG